MLGPGILTGTGLGLVIAPSINTGTFRVAQQDAGVGSAPALARLALAHGYDTAFWWTSAILSGGVIVVHASDP